jgi:Xaa-Pro dipeptidase
MQKDILKQELDSRLGRFFAAMSAANPSWNTAIILSNVNQYYFTGTMQDGMLVMKKNGRAAYFVRRSFERAKDESPFEEIYPIESYRDAASIIGTDFGNAYIETEVTTVGILERIKRYFNIESINSLDKTVLTVRSVKTPYELEWIERSGRQHNEFLLNIAPSLLKEGISEADFVARLYEKMVAFGYQGICRFSMFQSEMVVGQVGFGESSIYPTRFDGPGGAYGMCPAVPLVGSRERLLKCGDLVFVDIAFGMNGYHSDKTQVYMFGAAPTADVLKAHRGCIDVQKRLASLLKPGAIPSEIYNTVIAELDDDFLKNFMGYGNRRAKFLGHGVGLYVDEFPVIASGFNEPLAENMVIALEPKKGIANVGMVGVEDTYIVTSGGGRCVTGGGCDIITI